MDKFPYQGPLLNAPELFQNLLKEDLSPLVKFEGNIPQGWWGVPRNIGWGINGEILAFTTQIDAYDRGDVLTDAFSEEPRMTKCKKGHPSPFDYFRENQAEVYAKADELLQEDQNEGKPLRDITIYRRTAIWHLAKECETFKISVAKSIYNYLGSEVVLDMSAGHGDRVLGAAAAGVSVYHGFDPVEDMKEPYAKILQFIKENAPIGQLDKFEQRYKITSVDFLQVNLPPESYDTVFTSPPFYDYEIYAPLTEKSQSIYQRDTLQKWLTGFYEPYLKKAYDALKKGRYYSLYIADAGQVKFVQATYNYLQSLGATFIGTICSTDYTFKRGYPVWIWQKPI